MKSKKARREGEGGTEDHFNCIPKRGAIGRGEIISRRVQKQGADAIKKSEEKMGLSWASSG